MTETGGKYKQGKHPNSLKNLVPGVSGSGRKTQYGSKKKKRGIYLTDESFDNLTELAQKYGCSSVSDLLEKFSRGMILIDATSNLIQSVEDCEGTEK
ncbi:MAG: hypothetical protein QNJ54_21975 [Prochloraceae cyanobacterium]|nr:hypothetical protein [Prochloraceae cyanobacterium]